MKWKGVSKVLSAMAVSTLLLSACGGSGDKEKTTTPEKPSDSGKEATASKFSMDVKNDKKEIEDGSFTMGLSSASPFDGLLNYTFYKSAGDSDILTWFDESLLDFNADFQYTNDGAATFEVSADKKTITLKIRDNVNWSDGQPVTAEDLEYSYKIIAHKDYTGTRFNGMLRKVVGIDKYHKGETDKIEGIKIIDPKTISITHTDADPGITSGIWAYPTHKKYFGNMSVKDMPKSEQVRQKPIGFGPFKVEKILPGEQVKLVRNDNYWRGKPKLKDVVLKIVNPSVLAASLKNGEVDMAEIGTEHYELLSNLKNVNIIGKVEDYYNYVAFKLGKYDQADKVSKMNPNAKMADKNLRQAMAYAVDKDSIANKLYKGLRIPATTVIPMSHDAYRAKDIKGYTYDVEKAKKLLDDAGYKDTNGDNVREGKDGKEFKITFATRGGSAAAEAESKFLQQSWEKIGLKVEFLDGRLQDPTKFYEPIEKDDERIDVYFAAWSAGADPDPSGIWAKEATFNMPRWTNEKNDELLAKMNSPEAADFKYRTDAFKEWQQLIVDEVPLFPVSYRYQMHATNARVKNYSVDLNSKLFLHDLAVTEKESVK